MYYFLVRIDFTIIPPTGIIIHHRIICTVGIQIQPISTISILLHKPPDYRIVIPGPQIVLLRLPVILLPSVKKPVRHVFMPSQKHPKGIILIRIFRISGFSRNPSRTKLLIPVHSRLRDNLARNVSVALLLILA